MQSIKAVCVGDGSVGKVRLREALLGSPDPLLQVEDPGLIFAFPLLFTRILLDIVTPDRVYEPLQIDTCDRAWATSYLVRRRVS